MVTDMFRWIYASVVKHAEANRAGIPLWKQGQGRNTSTAVSYFELRISDFNKVKFDAGSNKYFFTVNINVSTNQDGDGVDLYTNKTNIGIANNILDLPISIHKYGSEAGDDESLVGCSSLVDNIETNDYGILIPGTSLLQSTVEAVYEITV